MADDQETESTSTLRKNIEHFTSEKVAKAAKIKSTFVSIVERVQS